MIFYFSTFIVILFFYYIILYFISNYFLLYWIILLWWSWTCSSNSLVQTAETTCFDGRGLWATMVSFCAPWCWLNLQASSTMPWSMIVECPKNFSFKGWVEVGASKIWSLPKSAHPPTPFSSNQAKPSARWDQPQLEEDVIFLYCIRLCQLHFIIEKLFTVLYFIK